MQDGGRQSTGRRHIVQLHTINPELTSPATYARGEGWMEGKAYGCFDSLPQVPWQLTNRAHRLDCAQTPPPSLAGSRTWQPEGIRAVAGERVSYVSFPAKCCKGKNVGSRIRKMPHPRWLRRTSEAHTLQELLKTALSLGPGSSLEGGSVDGEASGEGCPGGKLLLPGSPAWRPGRGNGTALSFTSSTCGCRLISTSFPGWWEERTAAGLGGHYSLPLACIPPADTRWCWQAPGNRRPLPWTTALEHLPLPKHPGEQVTRWVDDALRGCGSSLHASLSRTVGWQLELAWWEDPASEKRDLRRFPRLCLLVVRLGKTTQPLEVSASSFDSVVQVK